MSDKGSQVGQVASDRVWPGVRENAVDDRAYKVEEERKRSKGNQWVTLRLQEEQRHTQNQYATHRSPFYGANVRSPNQKTQPKTAS